MIEQANGFSYEELAFHLADSQSCRALCLLGFADQPPSKSTLQHTLATGAVARVVATLQLRLAPGGVYDCEIWASVGGNAAVDVRVTSAGGTTLHASRRPVSAR